MFCVGYCGGIKAPCDSLFINTMSFKQIYFHSLKNAWTAQILFQMLFTYNLHYS